MNTTTTIELLTIKKYVAPTIQAEREKQKFREELEQLDEPPLPPAPKVSTSPALKTSTQPKTTSEDNGNSHTLLSSAPLMEHQTTEQQPEQNQQEAAEQAPDSDEEMTTFQYEEPQVAEEEPEAEQRATETNKKTNKKKQPAPKPKTQRATRASTRNTTKKKTKEQEQEEEEEQAQEDDEPQSEEEEEQEEPAKPTKQRRAAAPKKATSAKAKNATKTTTTAAQGKKKPPALTKAKKQEPVTPSKYPEQVAGEELEKAFDEEEEQHGTEMEESVQVPSVPDMPTFPTISKLADSPFQKPLRYEPPTLRPRRLFTETSELDTTFDDFDLTDNIQRQLLARKVLPGQRGKKRTVNEIVANSDEEEAEEGESNPSQNMPSTPPPLDLQQFADELGEEGELLRGVMTIMQSAIKKKMEAKRRKIDVLKRGVIEFMDEKVHELVACSDRDRADLHKNYLEKMEQVKGNISSQAKRMKDSYNKFQKEISSQLAKHSELMSKVDLLQESFKEKLKNLETRDAINLDKLEKQVKLKIEELNQQANELNYPQSDDMSKRLKEVVRALSF